jgi:hypothetical protein
VVGGGRCPCTPYLKTNLKIIQVPGRVSALATTGTFPNAI